MIRKKGRKGNMGYIDRLPSTNPWQQELDRRINLTPAPVVQTIYIEKPSEGDSKESLLKKIEVLEPKLKVLELEEKIKKAESEKC
jgi:hypothetical protein